MILSINVAECETQPLWERGTFRTAYRDLTEPFGAQWIGATVFDTGAGFTRGPFHYHDGVEEWMYVVSGEPVLRDQSGQRTLQPGALVAFSAGPAGAHTYDGPGRVVMFSMGARGWGEAFTSVYTDADKIGGKPGVQFVRSSALETWNEPRTEDRARSCWSMPRGQPADASCRRVLPRQDLAHADLDARPA